MKKASAFLAVALLAAMGHSVHADQNVSGYSVVSVAANSDARIVVPFSQSAVSVSNVSEFAVLSKTGTGVTVTGTPFTTNQFQNTYYVRFISGNAEGLWSTITANTNNELTLGDAGVLGKVTGNETFRIYKHLTINDVFKPSYAGTLFSNVNGQSQVLIYNNDLSNMIQNRGAVSTATFFNGAWLGSANGNTIVKPNTQVVFRNSSPNPASILVSGQAPDFNPSFLIAPNGDVVIGTGLPLPITLAQSHLGGTNQRAALFFNTAGGINSQAIGSSTYFNGNWIGAINGTRVIQPSESVTLRLPVAEAGTQVSIPNPLK